LFSEKNQHILNLYFTAGYPELNDTATIIEALEEAGADMVEIGFPFSDPVADGEVIQMSSYRSLQNGMNLDLLFDQLSVVKHRSRIPKILMGYYNTVYQYGMPAFIKKCKDCGVDGVILPDLPPEIYEREYQAAFEESGLHFICLVSPQTSPERAQWLASLSRGFLYLLSSSSTTGSPLTHLNHFNHLNPLNPSPIPTLIGFGIHDHSSFMKACELANGAIIGSRFIRELSEINKDGTDRQHEIRQLCRSFVSQIKNQPA